MSRPIGWLPPWLFGRTAYLIFYCGTTLMTAWWGQIREVGVKVLATFRPVMLRIRDDKIPRTPHVEIAQVVQRPMRLLVPIGRVTTTRTRLPRVVATV